jgi:hypothetical protein
MVHMPGCHVYVTYYFDLKLVLALLWMTFDPSGMQTSGQMILLWPYLCFLVTVDVI